MSAHNHIRQVIKTSVWRESGRFKHGTSWCGRDIWGFDMPVELDVAKILIEEEAMQQPCKHCMKAALKSEDKV